MCNVVPTSMIVSVSLVIVGLLLIHHQNHQSVASSPIVQPPLSIFDDLDTRAPPNSTNQTEMGAFRMRFRNFELDFEMSQPPGGFCDGKQILIIVVTRADIEGYLFRRAIRKSWLKKEASISSRLTIFVLNF